MSRIKLFILAILATMIFAGGCGDDGGGGGVCDPGSTQVCTCTGGGTGERTCNMQGEWWACANCDFCAGVVCGDGFCDTNCETTQGCPADCGGIDPCENETCGNGYCHPNCETTQGCPADCEEEPCVNDDWYCIDQSNMMYCNAGEWIEYDQSDLISGCQANNYPETQYASCVDDTVYCCGLCDTYDRECGTYGGPGTACPQSWSCGTCSTGYTCDTNGQCDPDTPPTCNDGNVDPGEDCDGANLDGNNCTTVPGSFTGGTLSCSNCSFNTSGCTFCGDGVCNGNETTGTCSTDCSVTCIENWWCTPWSPSVCPCSDQRTRTCTDANNCGTTADKPSEVQSCNHCGNGSCDCLETSVNCPLDCPVVPTCGDGVCNGSETCVSCASDCCPNWTCNALYYDESPPYCDCGCGETDPDCGSNGCVTPGCYDSTCDWCWPGDGSCSFCGNGVCDSGETSFSCLTDCPLTCNSDAGEPNDSIATASNAIGASTSGTINGLSACPTDDDYFSKYLNVGDIIQVDVTFTHVSYGNINLKLLESGGVTVADSLSSTSNESLTYQATSSGWYYIRIYLWNGSQPGNTYSLSWSVTCGTPPDSYEPNDDEFSPYVVASSLGACAIDWDITNLTRHSNGDVDCFRWFMEDDGICRIEPVFSVPSGWELTIFGRCYFGAPDADIWSGDGDSCWFTGPLTAECTCDNDFYFNWFNCPAQTNPDTMELTVCVYPLSSFDPCDISANTYTLSYSI